MLIGDLVANNARRIPDHEGLIWENKHITWAKLNQRVNRLANGLLGLGLQPGNRVAFLLNNCKEIVELYYAVAKIGCISAPIMPRSVGREIAYIVNNVEASMLVVGAQHAALVEEVREELKSVRVVLGVGDGHPFREDYNELVMKSSDREPRININPDSIYAIFHSSGTTGRPKGCMIKHGSKMVSNLNLLAHLPHHEDDRAMIFTPLNLSLGADMLHTYVLRGIPIVLLPKFDEIELLEMIERERISSTFIIESTFDRFVTHPDLDRYNLGSIRYLWATSATRDAQEGIKRLRQVKSFRGRFWNAYGSTETGGAVTFCSPHDIERALEDPHFSHIFKSIGRESMLSRVDCVDDDGNPLPCGQVGEMTISSPGLFTGYWNQPEQTREVLHEGRYFTGDLARKDENGFIYLEGRKKDMIKSGGINVYPAEVEEILRGHSKVAEVAVVGVPDEHWGEKAVACVVTTKACTEKELLDYCSDKLAGYKQPKSVLFLDGLPKDRVGKILKRQLREELSKK
jgi:acyl-CoA synthetase (AMP-forming)/AMP-acid ligase II